MDIAATSTQHSSQTTNGSVKEFSFESGVVMVNDKPAPRFSLDHITVKKGDAVRLKITVTSGHHDFKLDEFNIYKDTPTGKETVIEFVADKIGDFVYYCNQPGHRGNGHWGTLTVTQ